MANASIDSNSRASLTGLLNTNGSTITRVKIDATTHALSVDDAASGSDAGGVVATDSNGRPIVFAVSSADGITPVPLYVNSSGMLLINSN